MANIYTIAGNIEKARQVGQLRDDVEPLLITAVRLWQKVCTGQCPTRTEQAEAVRGCLLKLQMAAQAILTIEEAGVVPVNGAGGNGKFAPQGTVGGHDNESHAA